MIHVVIPVHNRINYTIDCIKSLKKQDCASKLKILLIDDGSSDNTKQIIRENFPDIKILSGNGSLFWCGAVNYGIRHVLRRSEKKDWLLLVNNDVEFKTNSISNLVKNSEKFDRKVIMGSLTVAFEDKKTIIKSGTIVKNWFLNITSHKFVGNNLSNIDQSEPIEVDFLTGRCLLHPIEIFKKVKNYDSKNFPHYGADDEFSMRIKKFGYSSMLCPSSIVYLKENNLIHIKKNFFLKKLFDNFFSIKSSANIINKFNLAIKVVPVHAKLTFFLVGVLKSFYIFFYNVKK